MMRKFLTIILPLIAPILVYATWAWFSWRVRKAKVADEKAPQWQEFPWTPIVASGIALTAATLVILAVLAPEGINSIGEAPHLEGGKVIPFSKIE
jgi:heme/copper-type cytochrome/quinol oxidase subunit 2